MIRMTTTSTLLVLLALAGGCGIGEDSPQVITGRVKLSSFPEPVTHVRAVGHKTTVDVPLAADGSFSVTVAPLDRYRLQLHSAVRHSDLVFPRRAGYINTTFFVQRNRAAMNLGNVRYLHDPKSHAFVFGAAPECVDGAAPGGAVCIEEPDGANNQAGADEADGDNHQCGVNVDEPDGANNNGDFDGATGDNNLPQAIGCEVDDGPGTDQPGSDGGGTTPPGDDPGPIL